ncbi:unnamed protein product, partial [Ceratitis capitata]
SNKYFTLCSANNNRNNVLQQRCVSALLKVLVAGGTLEAALTATAVQSVYLLHGTQCGGEKVEHEIL